MSIRAEPLPEGALLARYRDSGYTDCFTTEIHARVGLERYVEAFYTTPLFRVERFVLACFGYGSSDESVARLANGEDEPFAVWQVEARSADQLLLSDVAGRTRSWLMSVPNDDATRLFFGSAVVSHSTGFRVLLGFHRG